MGFFGGASKKEKRAQEAATKTAESRFGDIYSGTMEGANVWGGRSRERAGTMDTRSDWMWDQLGEGGAWAIGAGGGGGGPAWKADPNSIWGQLRDTGDLTGGDWANARKTYNLFNETGGFTDQDLTNLRQRALAGTQIYDPSQDARSRVQGGWGGGGAADSLAQQKAIADLRNKAAWSGEAYISDKTREGKQWGASSLEGLGSKVQAGRIQGQTQLDQERAKAHAAAAARARASQASADANWSRRMQLLGMGYSNVGLTGADLPYYQAAGNAAQGAVSARQNAFGQQQQNAGWGQQLMNMASTGAKAYASAMFPPAAAV